MGRHYYWTDKPCRHCGRKATRSRQLCARCYELPGVRRLYPSLHRMAKSGSGIGGTDRVLPDAPSDKLPGTPERIAEYQRRAEAGVRLWHPKDAVWED